MTYVLIQTPATARYHNMTGALVKRLMYGALIQIDATQEWQRFVEPVYFNYSELILL